MKKFLLGILCGFVFAALALIVVGFALVRVASKSSTEIAKDSYLVLRLEGEVREQPAGEIPLPWFEAQTPWTVLEIRQMLERAAGDSRIKGLLLETGGAELGWAKAQEIRGEIVKFAAKGKPVHAFLRRPNAKDYFIATAAQRISMVEEDVLDLKGLRVERTYFKNTLDKLGVQMEVEAAGKYKDFGDSFTKTGLSPESRESLGAILNGIYGVLVKGIAEGRKRPAAEVEKLMDEGPYLAQAALATKLVDALEYDSAAREELAKKANTTTKAAVSAREYRKQIRQRWERPAEKRIAYFVAEGDIVRGGGLGDGVIASRDFVRYAQELKGDDEYQAVLLRIDSPGGDAVASDELLAAVKELSKAKPTVISFSDVAASGGYYMAVTGDPIFAYPATITGSIGVVYGRPNLKGLYEKIGLTKDGMQRGKNADLDSEYKPLSEVGRKKLREGIDQSYRTFVARVAEGRKAKPEEIEPLAQGRAWVASDAGARKLVDQLGGLDEALKALREKAKFGPEERVALVPYPAVESALDKWFREETSVSALVKLLLPEASATQWEQVRRSVRPAWLRGGMLRAMPYTLEVK